MEIDQRGFRGGEIALGGVEPLFGFLDGPPRGHFRLQQFLLAPVGLVRKLDLLLRLPHRHFGQPALETKKHRAPLDPLAFDHLD